MAIEINNGAVTPRERTHIRRDSRGRRPEGLESALPPKLRASENFIPSPESLATLIESAVAALRKGVRWDRGTILNLLV